MIELKWAEPIRHLQMRFPPEMPAVEDWEDMAEKVEQLRVELMSLLMQYPESWSGKHEWRWAKTIALQTFFEWSD